MNRFTALGKGVIFAALFGFVLEIMILVTTADTNRMLRQGDHPASEDTKACTLEPQSTLDDTSRK